MTKRFVIGVEIYQTPNGSFEVHAINQSGKFDDDKRVNTIISNDDEFYANAVCTAIRELCQ